MSTSSIIQPVYRTFPAPSLSPSPCMRLPPSPKHRSPSETDQHVHFIHAVGMRTPPSSSPTAQDNLTRACQPAVSNSRPTQYTSSEGSRDTPGSAAYYKSWAFRNKVNEGSVLAPVQESSAEEDFDDSADEDYGRQSTGFVKKASLVLIFSRTSVRRAKAGRKVDRRMQRANRRL